MADAKEGRFEVEAGTGPEYDFPTTGKDATVPVVNEEPVDEGEEEEEDERELTDEEIAREEELENQELETSEHQWSEDKAVNTRQPGEAPDLLPEERRLPSDVGA